MRMLVRSNIQAADTCSSLTLDLEHLDQLSIALLLQSGHVFASQLVRHTASKLIDALRIPSERVVPHVLCPCLRCRTEVLEKMLEAIATASATHGIRHERADDCPSGSQACGHTSIYDKLIHVSTFVRSDFSVGTDLPSSSAVTMPRATRL